MSKEEKVIFIESLQLFSTFQSQWNKNISSSIIFLISVLKCIVASWLLSQCGLKQKKKYIGVFETTRFQVLQLPNCIAGDQSLATAS